MKKDTVVSLKKPAEESDPLSSLLREGARALLHDAVEAELATYLSGYEGERDASGRRRLVRNGYLPARMLLTGLGEAPIRAPKTRDRGGRGRHFTSRLLPPYIKRTASVESVLPWLYLKGVSTGDMSAALAVGDGALGFWAALREVYPTTRTQRCWVRKTANVLNKLPKGVQAIWMAESRAAATRALNQFIHTYEDKYPKATACLEEDRDSLLAFYDFPAAHWQSIRTTNPIESTFATVRLRTARTRGCVSRTSLLTMVYKLGLCAEQNWRRLRGFKRLADVIENVKFIDGVKEETSQQHQRAA